MVFWTYWEVCKLISSLKSDFYQKTSFLFSRKYIFVSSLFVQHLQLAKSVYTERIFHCVVRYILSRSLSLIMSLWINGYFNIHQEIECNICAKSLITMKVRPLVNFITSSFLDFKKMFLEIAGKILFNSGIKVILLVSKTVSDLALCIVCCVWNSWRGFKTYRVVQYTDCFRPKDSQIKIVVCANILILKKSRSGQILTLAHSFDKVSRGYLNSRFFVFSMGLYGIIHKKKKVFINEIVL